MARDPSDQVLEAIKVILLLVVLYYVLQALAQL